MNLKQKIKEIIISLFGEEPSDMSFSMEDMISETDSPKYKTHKGSVSYEYLKILKKIQIYNKKQHDQSYLYLLLYFACRTKMIVSGEMLYAFEDTFEKDDLPFPVECMRYVVKDNLDLINDPDDIKIFIGLFEKDQAIIRYVCNTYGSMSLVELMQKYREDRLQKLVEYGTRLPVDDPNLISEEDKGDILVLK